MIYLLDTNVCIKLLNNNNIAVTNKLRKHKPEEIYLSTIVQFELYYGAYKSSKLEKNLVKLERFCSQFIILTFDEKSAKTAGKIRTELNKLGTPIGVYDLQIASIALANNLILVTHNIKEFSRIENLQYEDWEI